MAAFDRDDPQRAQHLGVDDLDRPGWVQSFERTLGCAHVELHSAGKTLGQTSEQEVRVRHRRHAAAAVVGGRARLRAGALRPDPQRAARIAPDDRASPRADRVQVDGRQVDRQPVDGAFARALGVTAGDQANVRRGAAHVEGDRVLDTGEGRDACGTDHSRGRP